MPLAQAIALTFIAPLIAMLLAAATLDEKVGRSSLVGSIGAFAGVVVIVVGQAHAQVASDVLLGIAAIIGSALCYAVNIVLMRHQALAARPLEINFFQCLTVMALWILVIPTCRAASLARRAMDLGHRRRRPFNLRHPAVRLGLCPRARELPCSHRI